MPDPRKDLWKAISTNEETKDLFVDEADFNSIIDKSPKDVYKALEPTGLFVDYDDFKNIAGLKKNESLQPSSQPYSEDSQTISKGEGRVSPLGEIKHAPNVDNKPVMVGSQPSVKPKKEIPSIDGKIDIEQRRSSSTAPVVQTKGLYAKKESDYYEYPKLKDGDVIEKGNIDLSKRPQVKNEDGSISTVKSMSIGTDQGEVLIPMVSNEGTIMNEEEAINYFRKTGQHLGIYSSVEAAQKAAVQIHNDQERSGWSNKSIEKTFKEGYKVVINDLKQEGFDKYQSTRSSQYDLDKLVSDAEKVKSTASNESAALETALLDVESDYLDFLNETNPELANYKKSQIEGIREKRRIGKELNTSEEKVLRDFRQSAIEARNNASEIKVYDIKQTTDFDGFNKRTAPLYVKLNNLDEELKKLRGTLENRQYTQKEEAQEESLLGQMNALVDEIYKVRYDTGVTVDKEIEFENAVKNLSGSAYEYTRNLYGDVKQLEEENKARLEKRYNEAASGDKSLLGAAWNAYTGAIGTAAFNIAKLPKILGDALGDTDYDALDEMYNAVDALQERRSGYFDPPSKEGGDYGDLPASYRYSRLFGQGLGSIVSLSTPSGALGLTGKASNIAVGATAFATSEADFYEEALAMGMNPKEASTASTGTALVTAFGEGILNDYGLFEASASFKRTVMQAVKEKGFKEGVKQAIENLPIKLTDIGVAGNKEGAEEVFGQGLEDVTKEVINIIDPKGDPYQTFTPESYVESYIGGFMPSAGLRVFARPQTAKKERSPFQETILLDAVENKEGVIEQSMLTDEENSTEVAKVLTDAEEIYNGLKGAPSFDKLSKGMQAHVLSELQRKKKLEEALKVIGVSDKGIEAEIAAIEEEVKSVLETGKTIFEVRQEENKAKAEIEKPSEQIDLEPTITEEVKPTEEQPIQETESQVAEVKVGDTVTLPPRIANGQERTMVFTDQGWKQKVGDQVTEVNEATRNQAQEAFNLTAPKIEVSEKTESEESQKYESIKNSLPDSDYSDKESFEKDLKDGSWAFLTAENPDNKKYSEEENEKRNREAERWLESKGYKPQKVAGKYDRAENSYYVKGMLKSDAIAFANIFGQESVATNEGLYYQDGSFQKRVKGEERFGSADNYVSAIKIGGENVEFSIKYEDAKNTPQKAQEKVAGNKLFSKPLEDAFKVAVDYMKSIGKKKVIFKKVTNENFNKDYARKIAKAFEEMKNDPSNKLVREAYEAMAKETMDQYNAIVEKGYSPEINNTEPYSSSEEMIADLRDNKRMKIFSTESGFGDTPITDQQRAENPLLRDSGVKDINGVPLLINDVFRFVHDFFGHAELGNGFGAVGEENAWRVHAGMYSPLARRAMTTETRGQNSWVNFSGVNDEAFSLRDKARALRGLGELEAAGVITEEVYGKMKFADQKIGLLPEEFSEISDSEIQSEESTDLGYHGGNLQEKSDYLRQGYRGDVPFTGHYFFSDRARAEDRGNRSLEKNKQVSVVDFSKYNLLKPTTNEYWAIKSGLKKFEDKFLRNDIESAFSSLEDFGGLKSNAPKLYSEIIANKDKIEGVAKNWKENELYDIDNKKKIERLETVILKALGYEGIDVRGLKDSNGEASPDSASEGSVIFDIKPESVVESPLSEKPTSEKTETPKDLEGKEAAKAKVDAVAARIKEALKAKGIEGIEVQKHGFSSEEIIDMVANGVKSMIDVGYAVKDAIDYMIEQVKDIVGNDADSIRDRVETMYANQVTEVFTAIEDAKRSKKIMSNKKQEARKAAEKYGEVGKKAIFVDENFEDIVQSLLKDKKITRVCP